MAVDIKGPKGPHQSGKELNCLRSTEPSRGSNTQKPWLGGSPHSSIPRFSLSTKTDHRDATCLLEPFQDVGHGWLHAVLCAHAAQHDMRHVRTQVATGVAVQEHAGGQTDDQVRSRSKSGPVEHKQILSGKKRHATAQHSGEAVSMGGEENLLLADRGNLLTRAPPRTHHLHCCGCVMCVGPLQCARSPRPPTQLLSERLTTIDHLLNQPPNLTATPGP